MSKNLVIPLPVSVSAATLEISVQKMTLPSYSAQPPPVPMELLATRRRVPPQIVRVYQATVVRLALKTPQR